MHRTAFTRPRRSRSGWGWISLLSLLSPLGLLSACGGADEGVRARSFSGAGDGAPGSDMPGILSTDTPETGSPCPVENLTQACRCGALPGRQQCETGRLWGVCECAERVRNSATEDPPANKGNATFSWLRTNPGVGQTNCKPGHYEGTLDGLYNAPSAFNAPVPIVSIDATGMAGMQVDLSPGGNGEFLTVTGGKLRGVALAIFPFEADFADGMLDCSTGLFRARLINGTYVVFFDGFYGGKVVYQFEGDIVARYDGQAEALVDGRWSVSEGSVPPPAISPDMPPPLFPPAHAGGTGTWTVSWVR